MKAEDSLAAIQEQTKGLAKGNGCHWQDEASTAIPGRKSPRKKRNNRILPKVLGVKWSIMGKVQARSGELF